MIPDSLRLCFLLCCACWALAAPPLHAATPLLQTSASPDVPIAIDGVATGPEDVAVQGTDPTALADLGPLAGGANVVAYHAIAAGHRLFVLDAATVLPGVGTVEPQDVVRWDGLGYRLAVDGSTCGVANSVRIDALSIEVGNPEGWIVSFDEAVVLDDGQTAEDEDLVNLCCVCGAGAQTSLRLDLSSLGVPAALDVDAAHAFASGRLLFSFTTSGVISGVFFDDEDLVELDPATGTWELAADISAGEPSWQTEGADLDALHAVPSCVGEGDNLDRDPLCDFVDATPLLIRSSSPDVALPIDGVSTGPDDVVQQGPDPTALYDLGPLPSGLNVRGFHRDPVSGEVFFALDAVATLPGIGLVETRDIVGWDGAAYSFAMQGSQNSIWPEGRINAITRQPDGDWVVSFDANTRIGSENAESADLVEIRGGGFNFIIFTGSSRGWPLSYDIDAVHRFPIFARYLLSFSDTVTLDGTSFAPEDVIEQTGFNTWTLAVDSSELEPNWAGANLDGFHMLPAFAATTLAETSTSPDAPISVDGVSVENGDVVVQGSQPTLLADLGPLPAGVDISAYDRISFTEQLFALAAPATLPDVGAVDSRDVVLWDGQAYSLWFDGDAGVPQGVSVDAIAGSGRGTELSFDGPLQVGSVQAEDEDLVRVVGSTLQSITFDGSTFGVPASLNVDAAHVYADDGALRVLLSFDQGGTLGGVSFQDEDVVEVETRSNRWRLLFDGSETDPSWSAANLDAFHMIPGCAEQRGNADADNVCDIDDACIGEYGPGTFEVCGCGDADGNGFLAFGDAFLFANCAQGNCPAEMDPNDWETDNNGFVQFADAFNAARAVGDGQWGLLTCPRHPIPGPIP